MKHLTTTLLLLFVASVAMASDGPEESSMEQAIRSGLERSPEHYIAGVFETRGPVTCDESCWVEAEAVDVFAWRGPTEEVPTSIRLAHAGPASNASSGTVMGFLTPVSNSEIFGGNVLMVRLSEEEIERFRRKVQQALGG